jgi:hypothetical protein
MHNRIVKSLACLLMLLVIGCRSPLVSSVGYYGSTPGPQVVKDSHGQTVKTFVTDCDAEDARRAAIKGAGIIGLTFDVMKDKMLSGTTPWVPQGICTGCRFNEVYAVYFKKVGKHKTEMTIIVDTVSYCLGCNPQSVNDDLSQRLAASINSVLATY